MLLSLSNKFTSTFTQLSCLNEDKCISVQLPCNPETVVISALSVYLFTGDKWFRKHGYFIWGAVPMSDTRQTLDTLQTLLHECSSSVVSKKKKKEKKIQDTIGTREQEESNTILQIKENIHALNNNIAF